MQKKYIAMKPYYKVFQIILILINLFEELIKEVIKLIASAVILFKSSTLFLS